MSKHHPTQEQLSAYVSGAMSAHYATAIAAHLEYCEQCRNNAKKLEHVGGVGLEKISSVSVSSQTKKKLFERLDAPVAEIPDANTVQDTPVRADTTVPKVLRKLIPNGYEALNWKWTGPGIHAAKLESFEKGSQLSLLKIEPGKAIASHTHKSDEVTVVLEGSLSDEFGLYRAGDYVLMDEAHSHRPVASNDEVCICLTVIETPLHFTGKVMGLLNPVIAKYLA